MAKNTKVTEAETLQQPIGDTAPAANTRIKTFTNPDGSTREVDFGIRGKIKRFEEQLVDEAGNPFIRLTICTITGDSHVLDVKPTHPLALQYATHGVGQKIGDSIAKCETDEDINLAVTRSVQQFNDAVWVTRSEGGTNGLTDLIEAARRIKGLEVGSPEAVTYKTSILGYSEEKLKRMKNNNGIKAILAEIASEKAKARADKLRGVDSAAKDLQDLDDLDSL